MPLSDIHGNCHYVPYCKQITHNIYMVKPNNNKVNHTRDHFRVFHSLALACRVPSFQVSWSIPRSSSHQLLLPWQCQGTIRQSAWQGHREQRLWPHGKRGEESCIIPISVSIQCRLRVNRPESDLMPPRPHKKMYDSISSAKTKYLTNSNSISPHLLRHVPHPLCMLQSRISKFSIMECMA